MPTSGPGTSRNGDKHRRGGSSRGFTLLEIMVVVAIVGLFVGVAVLSTDLVGFQRKLEQEAFRLDALIGLASDEAILETRDFGVYICEDSYHFFLYDYDLAEWIPYAIRPFEVRVFEPDIIASLRMDDLPVQILPAEEAFPPYLSRELTKEALQEFPDPQIVILSSGEITPFEIEFVRESELPNPEVAVMLGVSFDGETEVAARAY